MDCRWTLEALAALVSTCEHGHSLLLLLSTISVCVGGAIILMRKIKKTEKVTAATLPPGPRALPIIGHLHLLGKNPHRSLYNLSKIHGPLMSLRLGAVPVVVASTPAAARQILQTHDQAFSGRPRPAAAVCITYDCTDITFAPPGPYWKLVRQLCVIDLFTQRRLESFKPVREDEMGALMRSVLADCSSAGGALVSDVRPKLLSATNNIISRMTLGKTLPELAISSQADPSLSIVALLGEMLHLLGIFNVGDYIPSLAWMDLQGCLRRSKVVARRIDTVLQEILDGRRDKSSVASDGSPQDLLDVLLSCSTKNVQITHDNIKSILLDMFIGGTDTSAFTIEWALAELLVHPRKMKLVQEELDEVVGKARLVQESDIPHLPYLRAVVSETMRLHPVIPFLVPHETIQSCTVFGFDVPNKTQAYVNVWAIGRDPEAWQDPLDFSPERFLESSVNVSGHHFQLLPFGSGRRGCPGWMLGLLNVQILLACLLQGFYWTIPSQLDMSEKYGIMMMKAKPLAAMASPKLPSYLYEAHL